MKVDYLLTVIVLVFMVGYALMFGEENPANDLKIGDCVQHKRTKGYANVNTLKPFSLLRADGVVTAGDNRLHWVKCETK